MAVTYTYALTKDKRHFGIYVKALSGAILDAIKWKFDGKKLPESGGIPVVSDRLMRVKTEQRAIKLCKKLNSAKNDSEHVHRLWRLHIALTEKELAIVKAQYYQIHTGITGKYGMQFTTIDKTQAEKLAIGYANNNVPSKLRKTVAKNITIPKYETVEKLINGKIVKVSANIEAIAETPKGAKQGEFNPSKRTIYMKRK